MDVISHGQVVSNGFYHFKWLEVSGNWQLIELLLTVP